MIWLACALAIVLIAGALVFAIASWVRARRLRARHERFAAQAVPPLSQAAERLVDGPRALYHGTRFTDGQEVLFPLFREPCVGDLWCTSEALFLQREASGGRIDVPLAWVEEAMLVRAYAPLAGKELPVLRLRWTRGGEVLLSDFSLPGGFAALEKLRKEIHLRAGSGSALEKLQRFVDAAKEI